MERLENGIVDNITEREFFLEIEHKNKVVIQSITEPTLTQPCFNCGKLHSDGDCDIPTYFVRCPRCWIVSFDRTGHRLPCTPTNTISRFCSTIFGKLAVPIFQLRVAKFEADVFFMNPNKGAFEAAHSSLELLSPATCGVFTQKESAGYHIISYSANVYSRISFLIAVCVSKQWRLRYRGILSPVHGLLLFQLKNIVGNDDIFSSMQDNTVAVFGLKPKTNAVNVQFRVFAKDKDDRLQNDTPGYYIGSAQWRCKDGYFDETSIDDILNGKTAKSEKFYDRYLYHNYRDLSLAEQQFN